MNKTKVFISQPMRDRTNEEIEFERKLIEKRLADKYGEDGYEVIDSFFKDAPHEAKPLWFLGKSIELLSTADICVFGRWWNDARGCLIEHECCVQYNIPIWEM